MSTPGLLSIAVFKVGKRFLFEGIYEYYQIKALKEKTFPLFFVIYPPLFLGKYLLTSAHIFVHIFYLAVNQNTFFSVLVIPISLKPYYIFIFFLITVLSFL